VRIHFRPSFLPSFPIHFGRQQFHLAGDEEDDEEEGEEKGVTQEKKNIHEPKMFAKHKR
jgi:hypothetical protein